MSQSDNTSAGRFSLMPGKVARFFLLFIVVLLITMGVIVQNAGHNWLNNQSDQLMDMSHAIHKRIDTGRYATWQIYDTIISAPTSHPNNLQETRLRQDLYYLEKPRRKTETLIFGTHDTTTLAIAQNVSNYLDILWTARSSNPWSMFYLNGQDNSLILVSTLPLKDLASDFKDNNIESIAAARRVEMLQQTSSLDEKESFSPLRRLSSQNSYYFTLRTTFNQPGRLANVVAFDLPVDDLVPTNTRLDNIQLVADDSYGSVQETSKATDNTVTTHLSSTRVEIIAPIATTSLRLVWRVPLNTMLMNILQNTLLPLLLNFGLLGLALLGYTTFRHQNRLPANIPSSSNELQKLRAFNEEIVAQLPLGLLVYDLDSSRILISNNTAEQLLPHLNLQNIIAMTNQHQGVIQVTINNELYEVRQFRSQIAPRTQIFVIRNQDHEIMVNKQLNQAQRLYEKNQQGRIAFLRHIDEALRLPVKRLVEQATQSDTPGHQALANQAQDIARLFEEIQLLNLLEADSWQSQSESFALAPLLDEVILEVLPTIQRKGLQLIVNNALASDEHRLGDHAALQKILRLLLLYSVTTLQIGKITLEISAESSSPDQLVFCLRDSGEGLSNDEIDNLHFPFLSKTSQDHYGEANGLTFYLCNKLAQKLGGYLDIKSHASIGTTYHLYLNMAAQIQTTQSDQRLLEDVIAMVDITSNEIRHIVTRQLENWGADCITPDERLISQKFDIFLTDTPANLTSRGLLLSGEENGMRKLGPGQFRVNFNIASAMQKAVLQLIDEQLSLEELMEEPTPEVESTAFQSSDYYALFVDTVPDDVKKLYTQSSEKDYNSLAQTTHRLKGVFAILNLLPGKRLCELLEQCIREGETLTIKKYINDLDVYVKKLL